MIDLYYWKTDNGYKSRHGIEESGLDYNGILIDLTKKEQFLEEFMKISPGHKIPAMIDHEGPGGETITIAESGAILKYLAQKSGNGLYPEDPAKQAVVDHWLFYGSATFTTLCQQYGFFHIRSPEDVPGAKKHYTNVIKDTFSVVDRRLSEVEYVADAYSIADIAMYADTKYYGADDKWIGFADYPNLKRWYEAISERPATQRGWDGFPG